MAISAWVLTSFARNCALPSLPISRWKRSCSAPRLIWRKPKKQSTKLPFHFTKNISPTRTRKRGPTRRRSRARFWTSWPSSIRTTIPSSVMRKKSCAKRPSLPNSATSSRCRKIRLRAICNAIIDQGIHAKNMSEKEAMDLMMEEGFQQEGEAVAKWKRARLSSAQLSTYFVGVAEHLDLRDRAKARDGTAFNLKSYNDTVISFGSPPVKYVRELMGL